MISKGLYLLICTARNARGFDPKTLGDLVTLEDGTRRFSDPQIKGRRLGYPGMADDKQSPIISY